MRKHKWELLDKARCPACDDKRPHGCTNAFHTTPKEATRWRCVACGEETEAYDGPEPVCLGPASTVNAPLPSTRPDDPTIILPTKNAPAEIRESFRSVLAAHRFVIARRWDEAIRPEDRHVLVPVDDLDGRYQPLLVELGNNAMQRLQMLAINRSIDRDEVREAAEKYLAAFDERAEDIRLGGATYQITEHLDALRKAVNQK